MRIMIVVETILKLENTLYGMMYPHVSFKKTGKNLHIEAGLLNTLYKTVINGVLYL